MSDPDKGGLLSRYPFLILPLIYITAFLVSCAIFDKGTYKYDPNYIVVYGDTRTNHDIHRKVVATIAKSDPVAVFHTGDLVNDGRVASQWDTFNVITAGLRDSTPFYPAIGNHEYNSQLYYDNFELPGNERWYSVTIDGILFIILDSNADTQDGSEQYTWLEGQLENIGNTTDYVIALFHHPPYSTGPHTEDEKGLRSTFVPLFEQYGVDIAFTGHDHCYERTLHNGIYYIVSGGGGAPLYDQERTSPESLIYETKYHFCRLTVLTDRLKIKAIDTAFVMIDSFSVSK